MRAMRWPTMTLRRWAIVIALAAVGFTLIARGDSPAVAVLALFGTLAVAFLTPVILVLFVFASRY